jgi:hypothetical protein
MQVVVNKFINFPTVGHYSFFNTLIITNLMAIFHRIAR